MTGKTCCCGCCSVRDGTRIIAVLCIISAAYGMGQQVHNLMIISNDPKDIADSYPAPDPEARQKIEQFFTDFQIPLTGYFVACLLLALLQLILSGLLFNGAQNNIESRCRPWLYFNFFFFALFVVFAVCLSLVVLIFLNFLAGFVSGLFLVIPIAIQGYFLNIVREYILELRYGTGSAAQGGLIYSPANPQENIL